jgi:hypothetical protein
VSDLEQLKPQQLYERFQPGEAGGQTIDTHIGNAIDTHIGNAMHDALKEYTHGSNELHLLRQENRAIPDSGVTGTELLLDLKRDSPRGRRNGQETRRKYQERLNRDTVILLYDVKQHEIGMGDLKDEVIKAWTQRRPNWRAEAQAKRKASAEAKKAATSQKKKQSEKAATIPKKKHPQASASKKGKR